MLRKLVLLILFAAPIPVLASICPASNAPVENGIGDGCTTSGFEYIPHIGIFKSTFKPACDAHDKCYTTLGADYDSCDSAFYEAMRARCNAKFNQWLQPVEWSLCRHTAFDYYEGVQLYRGLYPHLAIGFQYEALGRSIALQTTVDGGQCGTTPERTTLYASTLISRINSAWSAGAGRLPTIYEFLDVVNSGDYVGDPIGWFSILYSKAAAAAAVQPPAIGWSQNSPGPYGVVFTATPEVPGASYFWRIPDQSSEATVSISYYPPLFNRTVRFAGFVRVISDAGVPNMALVESSIVLPGTCAPNNGPWVNCQ